MAGLIRFENNKLTKNEARKIVSKYNVSDRILNKQFEQLNNEEYSSLFQLRLPLVQTSLRPIRQYLGPWP